MNAPIKKAISLAAPATLAVLGSKAALEFVGDGAGGIRDIGAQVLGAIGGLYLASKII